MINLLTILSFWQAVDLKSSDILEQGPPNMEVFDELFSSKKEDKEISILKCIPNTESVIISGVVPIRADGDQECVEMRMRHA